jgi:hypothetical protein
MRFVALALVLAVAACTQPDSAPSIAKLRPPWGPITGGTAVEILGQHFDPYVNRVYIAGREASVVRTIDEQHLEVVIPPGTSAGDAEVLVVTASDTVIATGVFRYSGPPEIESVSPAKVVLTTPTIVSVRGSGFVDEEAGDPLVLVNGQPVPEVTVRSDSWITFEAPPGVAFSRSEIQIVNRRGSANTRGFVYALTDRPGLLVFNLSSGSFATFYEPISGDVTSVPYISSGGHPCIYGVIRDPGGVYWASDYCTLGDWGFGRIDLATQTVVDGIPTGRLYPTMARHRGILYAMEYSTNRFGTLSPTGDEFTQIGTTTVACCEYGLASDDTTLWLVARDAGIAAIRTVDPETGTLGPAIPLVPNTLISDLRWYAGTIYGTTTSGNLVTIDPTTGVVTTLTFVGNAYALEVFE